MIVSVCSGHISSIGQSLKVRRKIARAIVTNSFNPIGDEPMAQLALQKWVLLNELHIVPSEVDNMSQDDLDNLLFIMQVMKDRKNLSVMV